MKNRLSHPIGTILKLSLLMTAFVIFCPALRAQTSSASVTGVVRDTSGAVIPGATVTLIDQGTNVSSRKITNSSGAFVFINVLPGTYVVTVEKAGFRNVSLPAFPLSVNQTLTENVTLEVGASTQTVTVSAQSEGILIQKSTSELGTVIGNVSMQQLPLNGRNFTQLLILTPGITPVSTAQGSGISATDAGITAIPGTSFYKPSVNGQENRENLFYLDGILNTDVRGAVYGVLPILDTLDEFKVQSQNDMAEYGGTLGGVVNVATKSGTNSFHGSAWEYDRNNAFDARNPFNDFCSSVAQCAGFGTPGGPTSRTPAPPGHYTQNEFGAAIGGPIIKNKTFFYGAYEGWRYSQATASFENVPTASELGAAPGLNGNLDFTGSLQGTIGPTSQTANQLYNPYSPNGATPFQCLPGSGSGNPFANPQTYVAATPEPVNTTPGAGYGAQPKGMACDVIPAALVNTQIVKLAQAYFLKPNFAPIYGVQNSNFLDTRPHTDSANDWQIRIDQNFGSRDTVFGRLSQMWVADTAPIAGTISENPQKYHAYNFGGAWDHSFRPNLIADFRAGAMLKPYTFYQNAGLPPVGFKPESAAGFPDLSATDGFFMTGVDGYTIGSQAANLRGNPVANADASLTWVKGSHNMRAGFQYIYTNRYQYNNFSEVDYSGDQTSSGLKSQPNEGNNLASSLLGLPSSFQVQTPTNALVYLRMPTWAVYYQDQWKVKPTLTLNLGLRYDYIPQASIIGPAGRPLNALSLYKQQWVIGENASAVAACTTPFVNPCIPNGYSSSNPNFTVTVPRSGQTYNTFDNVVYAGGSAAGQPIRDNVAPRVGVAWVFRPNTVLRAGYDIFYDTITARSQWVQNTELGADWPWTEGSSSLPFNQTNPTGGATGLSTMSSLLAQGVTPSVANTPWALNQNGGYVNDPNYTDARSQQWHVQVEHQLGSNMKFSIGYVGSHTGRLDWTGNANASHFSSPQLNSTVQTSPQGVTSCGAVGSATDTKACESAYYSAVDKLRLMPWGRSDYHYSTSTGYANYNALQAEFQRRFSNGLEALVSYTWSKCLGISSGWFNVENGTNGGTVTEDYFNQPLSYGPCGYDIPQDITVSAVYQLPFGQGKAHLNHGPLSWIFGNWESNLFLMGRSGQNFNVSNGGGDPAAISGSGGIGSTSVSGYDRPDVVPGQALIPSGQSQSEWFNPGAFCIIPSSPTQTLPKGSTSQMCSTAMTGGYPVFGDFGVGVLRDQFFYDVDFALDKTFRISETKSLQFRAEGFNIFNLQILGTPSASIGSGSTGVINGIASTPREFQLAMKFIF
ncbi:MAG TPA: TonB-dependent receptor [Terriglobia bacterium]|nr:TonB-dependent receptor [Terriglobia bacterium]